ncbi:hypothetical protein [Streptomyces pactum]|uniref:Uncharacterized protein n=1 Tax=Streptomyces pactum TaxID=68249 RepID=A0A1S6JCJ2_9ACTN|nr:hypothetical protein [Streptomyces pactum]AQS69485.1 hypothetical protein B1H29_23645 [Streptomyces pactum]
MTERNESGHRLAGRLYATLRVLRFLTRADSPKPALEDEFKEKDSPRQLIDALRLDPFEDLLAAVHRGRHVKALGEVFRAIPALVPLREAALKDNLGTRPLAEFNAGYRAQLADLKEALPKLLD